MSRPAEDWSYWHVPRAAFGLVQVPRLCLGDRGFLARYGSALDRRGIFERMAAACRMASIGLAAADEASASAARRCADEFGANPLVYHAWIRLGLGGAPVALDRLGAALKRRVHAAGLWSVVGRDRILGDFLSAFRGAAPYTAADEARLRLHRPAIDAEARRIVRYRPVLVTLGGDWLDHALLSGRLDLIDQAVDRIGEAADRASAALALFTYLAPLVAGLAPIARAVHGFMLPVNRRGDGMLPTPARALGWAARHGRPVLATHVLSIGRLSPERAIAHVYRQRGVASAVIGASQPAHMARMLAAARAACPADATRTAGAAGRRRTR